MGIAADGTAALIGRQRELTALQDAWHGGGAVHVVRGPAGIGKSRLARELSAWARARGGAVLVGRTGATGGDTPLRPIREALIGAARAGLRPDDSLRPFVPALARLVPEWGDAAIATSDSELVLGEAVLRLLAREASNSRNTAVLLLEDLQWADPETLAVVEYLADNVTGAPVLVVVTLRDGEPGAGADLVGALFRRRAAADLGLGPLDADDVVLLAQSCSPGSELPAGAAAALIERSEGVPFLVEELVTTAASAGWDTLSEAVPGSVVASIELRLGALPDDARRLVTVAAVLGRQFDWSLAARAAAISDEDAADHLQQAARAQLLTVESAGFRFRHTLTRDGVLTAVGPAERALWAGRALRALEPLTDPCDEAVIVLAAELARLSGHPDRAAGYLLRAARSAVDNGALLSADDLATRARGLAAGAAIDEVDELLLHVCALSGQTERAGALGARLLARRHDPIELADLHLELGAVDLAAGRWSDAEERAATVRSLAATDPSRAARADVLSAQAAMGRVDIDSALTAATSALEAARAIGDVPMQCEALEVIGRAARGRDLAAAEAAFTEAHDVATAAGLDVWRVRALHEIGTIDAYETMAIERLVAARREALTLGLLSTATVVDLQLAAIHDERGELDLALEAALRCEDASRRWKLSTLAMSLASQAVVHSRSGRRAEMDAAMDAALATGEDRDYVEITVWGSAVAMFQIVEGDLPSAASALDRAMETFRRRPAALRPFPGLWALVRTVIDDGGDAARAEVAALRFDMPVSRGTLAAAEAVALGRAGERTAAEARFADADAALAGLIGGFRSGLARLLVAPAAHRDGWGDPLGWLREALAVFETLGLDWFAARCRAELRSLGAVVPRRGRGESGTAPPSLARLGITSREVDVLALVAAGCTNREIGQHLFISTRTVDKHVERLMQKAGVTRAGLADVARDAGLLGT